jgi:uncharacterized protein with ParB-like and HNH nuclease domain
MQDVFSPLSLTISEVFLNGDPLYKIPNYQRPYSWKDEQVEKLWDDIYTAFSNNNENPEIDSNYFLGSLIVVPQGDGFEDVVDGQQRLTTLMILFNVVKALFPNINKEIDAVSNPFVIKIGKIRNCINNTNDLTRLRLYTHSSHQNEFENNVINCDNFSQIKRPGLNDISNSPKYKFINTSVIFYEKLSVLSEGEAGKFINYLFNQVKIIKISCSNRAFAIKLFQVLNDRGLDLSAADLIKSILLSNIKDDLKHNQFMADWQSVEEATESLDTDLTDLFTFYQYYLIGKNPKKSLVDELESEFKGKDSNRIISDFKRFVNIYKEVLFDEQGDKLIYSYWYLPWGVYWKTILLTAIHSEYPELQRLKLSLIRFYYLNWIAGKTLTAIKQTSFNVIGAIKDKKSMDEIEIIFNQRLTPEIISNALKNLSGNVYSQAWVKPLYLMVEYKQTDLQFTTYIIWDRSLQLEHILPQSYNSQEEWNHFDQRIAEKLLHSAGNLSLLSSKKNIEAQNYSFIEKINIYSGKGRNNTKNDGITSFRVSQKIVDDYNANKYNKSWNVLAIIDRYNWFIDEVGKILAIDTLTIKKRIPLIEDAPNNV